MPLASLFDRKRLALHRARARAHFSAHDVLFREAAGLLSDRLSDISRSFPLALNIGPGSVDIEGRVERWERADAACFEEAGLPFEDDRFDLVASAGGLHWVNDLVGALMQIRRMLKPDGLFLALLPGPQTLRELRASFEQAELDLKGGISPRISPFVEVRDAGNLLARAGFALPVADSELFSLAYDSPLALMQDLRGMGEANALAASVKHFTPRAVFERMAAHYAEHFARSDGKIAASFECVGLTGWKPHESQQKPAKRGSGKIHLSEI